MVVEVLAAGLHHLARAKANGSHYSGNGVYPLVPGVDGVVRDKEGNVRYVALDDTALGTFADRTLIDPRRSVILPDGIDPVRIAAAMNPAMSSWVALRRRVDFHAGQRVLVLGATGSAGRMAVQRGALRAWGAQLRPHMTYYQANGVEQRYFVTPGNQRQITLRPVMVRSLRLPVIGNALRSLRSSSKSIRERELDIAHAG
ncbi:hypothetical protein [Streptosporangium sp. NPDC049644]|uniref:hypothetical protein n=1 Tax=Streptosporangium sp. NPDC049644 TaxID=3155507 RepID=UPI003415FE2C